MPNSKADSGLRADYLVVGSGAMGMAFTDVLLTETEATVVMIDDHHRPGGHWNDAYPYVRLHQPSSFYGVNSKTLGNDVIDQSGWNAGLYELASGAEVCTYFDQVMQRQFLPTGRLRYFPSCDYRGSGHFVSIPSGREFSVDAKKTVDATYMKVSVPAIRAPLYDVAPGVRCVPLNELPRAGRPDSGYVIVGAGKTGMDACLWLLANEVDPDFVTWIMPRDSWMLDRAKIQPGEFFGDTAQGFARQMEAIAHAESIPALFETLLACGQLLRLDASVWPTMYRCATVTQAELEQLRRMRNVVRRGRVSAWKPMRSSSNKGRFRRTRRGSLSIAPRTAWPGAPLLPSSRVIRSRCNRCGRVSRCSAPLSSGTSRRPTETTRRKTSFAPWFRTPTPTSIFCARPSPTA